MITRADIFVRIATQGLVGFGAAPGTVATMMMIPMAYFLGTAGMSAAAYMCISSLLLLGGAYIVWRALPVFNHVDSRAIVLDEMVAFLLVFVGIPVNALIIILGFGLFRFFDIVKPFGIKKIETIPGVVGVMADDVAAAVISNIILQLLVYMSVL